MKTFNEFYAQWELIQKIYHENNDRETACELMAQLQFTFTEMGKGNWTTFCELAESMDCGNSIPVLRNTHSYIEISEYSKFFDNFEITEFAYCEESTATLQNIAEFLRLGWKVDMHAVDIHAHKWEEKTRKAIKFTR